MTPVSPELVCFATDQELIAQVSHFNQLYRAGSSPISDAHFDALFAELESRQPNHPLVANVQAAPVDSKGRVAHPFPMLSTEKAYESSEIRSWLLDVERQAELLGAKIQSSVNGKTNYLVTGANVGASKTSKAAALGVKVITEAEYLKMIS